MHYYGYKYHEIASMDAPTYDYLSKIMFHAKAIDKIELKELISYPHLESKAQSSLHRRLQSDSMSDKMKEDNAVSTDQLGSMGVSVGNIEDFIKGN